MKQSVQVSQLKARLSEYLRSVRRGGELIVMDRKTPVARIVPMDEEPATLRVRPPVPGALSLSQIPPAPEFPVIPDLDAILREERTPDR